MNWLRRLAPAVIGIGSLTAETIHLKTRDLEPRPDRTDYLASPLKRRSAGSSHYLIQFDGAVGAETFARLRQRGIAVVGVVPASALMIAAPDDFSLAGLPVRWAGRLEQRDKISPLVAVGAGGGHASRAYVVEFHADVNMDEARALVREHGLRLIENRDLARHHLLVGGAFSNLSRLASWDEVAYIFPASPELMSGVPSRACAGAIVQQTTVAQYAGTGYPWPVAGTTGLALNYFFSQMTEELPPAAAQSEILRAFSEWTKAAKVTFVSGSDPPALRTINILFARGAHGDPYPFDGPGGVLAHTFYPAPPNPEPIAADMHLDDDERWQIGANTDVFSVALHEAGHALGLVHTDNPADVMYPYYRLQTHLGSGDIAVVQGMYGANDGATPPPLPAAPPPPLSLTIQSPAQTSSTTASSISVSGATSGGAGAAEITWDTTSGQSGVATGSANWNIPAVPLSVGGNLITITATDTANDSASQLLSVIRQPAPTPPALPAGPPPSGPSPAPSPGNPPPAPPSGPPSGGPPSPQPPTTPGDTTPPWLLITYPGSTILATGADTIAFRGMAADNVGVTSVTWSNSTGSAGDATGTVTWVANGIPLQQGNNVITIRAFDAAGNSAWRTVMVVRQ